MSSIEAILILFLLSLLTILEWICGTKMRKNNQYKHLGLKPEEEQVFSGAPLIDKYDGSQHSHIQLYMDDETAEMPT